MIQPVNILVTHDDKTYPVECWCLSHHYKRVKALTMCGNYKLVRTVMEALGADGTFAMGFDLKLGSCDFGYQVIGAKVLQKDYHMVHVRSLDPKCLWTKEPKELFKALMAPPFETPLLPRWMPAFRAALESRKMLFTMQGHNPIGQILAADLTPKMLDQLASKGTSERKLNLR